jgi:protein phosphatase
MPTLKLQAAGLTDQGQVRKNNEDAVWVDPELGLLIVADGMGGHQSGEVASGMAITAIHENYKSLAAADNPGETADKKLSAATNRLAFCVKIANQMIFEAGKKIQKDKGMGTTCTAALIADGIVSLAHVGDSRAYLVRKGEMQQITNDHSLVMDQVRQGVMTKEEAAQSNMQNILTRALGTQPEVEVDMDEHPLFPGDRVLLCSDGLFKDMSEDDIQATMSGEADPRSLVHTLVQKANEAGGRDNITAAVGQVEEVGFGEKLRRLFSFLGK